jgi:rod shape-determining protein MreD
MMNYLKPLFYFIPLLILQLTVIQLISVFGIVPNLILILIVYYTLLGGQIYGTVLGFFLGFLFDIFSGSIIGSTMLSFTVAAFITGFFFNENKVDTNTASYFFLFIIFIASFIQSFIYSIVGNFNPDIGITVFLFEGGILPAVYTTLFGILLLVYNARKASHERL